MRDCPIGQHWTKRELAQTIEKIDGNRPGPKRLAQARRLFARALETPGGLKIQTIHAFCEAILHQFPLEANIAGHFELMDDMMQVALVGEARRQLLQAARLDHNTELSGPYAWLRAPVAEALAARRIYVAPGTAWGDEQHVRVTLSDAAATDRLLEALRSL